MTGVLWEACFSGPYSHFSEEPASFIWDVMCEWAEDAKDDAGPPGELARKFLDKINERSGDE